MSKRYESITANVVETKRPVVAGADRHPGWHALRKLAARITTPLESQELALPSIAYWEGLIGVDGARELPVQPFPLLDLGDRHVDGAQAHRHRHNQRGRRQAGLAVA